MKKIGIVLAGVAGAMLSVSGASAKVTSPFDWSGAYVGLGYRYATQIDATLGYAFQGPKLVYGFEAVTTYAFNTPAPVRLAAGGYFGKTFGDYDQLLLYSNYQLRFYLGLPGLASVTAGGGLEVGVADNVSLYTEAGIGHFFGTPGVTFYYRSGIHFRFGN